MSIFDDLRGDKKLFARCPSCAGEFRLAEADLFDATRPLTPRAAAHLKDERLQLREQRAELKKRQLQASQRPEIVAESVNIGKVVEKIAPSLPGFPVTPSDCRSLFEPIDYIVFKGLSERGIVDALLFVDVKSGRATLSRTQKRIRDLVGGGRVSLVLQDGPAGKRGRK